MSQTTATILLRGGLDLVTPAIAIDPGKVVAALNHEPTGMGYARIDGYERHDGRPKPSEAAYWVLRFDAGSAAIVEGDTVTGATSGASGVALIDAVVESGSHAGGDAAGYIVLFGVSGTFQDNEALQVGGVTKATAASDAVKWGASNDTDHNTWHQDAIETTRAAIGMVPGGGPIRGVWVYAGTVYAFRDDAASGATECRMYKATSNGWQQVALGTRIDFTSGGTYEIKEGDVITGATSGATATVERVAVRIGSFNGGDAEGTLIISGQSGGFVAEDLNVGVNTNVATVAGNSQAITLAPGGRFEFVNHNFHGHAGSLRMYGCDGVNKAFEFDGSVFVPIATGMTTDTPKHIAAHSNHLFLAFAGGSIQHSSIGEPYRWEVLTGAAEIAVGAECTGLLAGVAGVLVIFTERHITILYGSDSANWERKTLTDSAGAWEWSAQAAASPLYIDDAGVRDLRTTQAFGDFRAGTLSDLIEPWLRSKRNAGAKVTASMVVKRKNLYRLFWDDGDGLALYFAGRQPEFLPLNYGRVVRCCCASEDADGREVLFFGSDDGYVYQLDAGTSFDGAKVQAYLRTPFSHYGSRMMRKRFHKITLEVQAAPTNTIYVSADFSYGDPEVSAAQEQNFTISGGGGFWNESNWDEFYWDSSIVGIAHAFVDGIGTSMSCVFLSDSIHEEPYTLYGYTVHYSGRGLVR